LPPWAAHANNFSRAPAALRAIKKLGFLGCENKRRIPGWWRGEFFLNAELLARGEKRRLAGYAPLAD
jgi:hypothetical protein